MLVVISFLTLFLTLVYVVIVAYFRYGWQSIEPPVKTGKRPATRVSVIMAARNEEDKIALTIEDILAQEYPLHLFELIVVDDHSTDRTADIVSSYSTSGVKLISLQEDKPLNSYKKKAITEAIEAATGELIITTDADCRMKSRWLSTLVDYYEGRDLKLISAPVVFFEEKSVFERLQTLEFLYLIGLGAAGIGNRKPSTCNGANLAYRKSVFEELGGFQGIDDLASGDDELFLHKVASKYPNDIGFCKSSDALVYTHAKPNLREFIRQRQRWASKSTRYKDKAIVVLGVGIWVFNFLLIINSLLAYFFVDSRLVFAVSMASKLVAELIFLLPVTAFVKRTHLLFNLPLLTIVHTLYIVYIGIAGNSGRYIWKGRLVK